MTIGTPWTIELSQYILFLMKEQLELKVYIQFLEFFIITYITDVMKVGISVSNQDGFVYQWYQRFLWIIMDWDVTVNISESIISCFKLKLDTKIWDKRNDFSFPVVSYLFLDDDVPLSPLYGVYISQLVWFAHIFNNVLDINKRNLYIIAITTSRFSIPHAHKNFYIVF